MKWKNYLLTGLGAVVLCLAATFGFLAVSVHAETGAVYSCNINRCYSHPVTGEIEDSGGEASYATGQGMVEGAVYGSGLMEVTDSGNYYLTIRMSLIDYTSNHSFSVQNVGDSGWSGTCIVRVSMYVSPMGRDVTFYLYPSDYSEGNSVGMNPAFVTETASAQDSGSTESVSNGTLDTGSGEETETSQESENQSGEETEAEESTEGNETGSQSDAAATQAAAAGNSSGGNANAMNSGNTVASAAQAQAAAANKDSGESDTDKELNTVFAIALAVTGSGLVLILVTALIIWYFRKNWRRWGGEDDDDDEY